MITADTETDPGTVAVAEPVPWWKRQRIERTMRHPTGQLIRKDKAGRNEPCPCGSGKKHKRCHNPGERNYTVKTKKTPQANTARPTPTDLDEITNG